MDKKKNIKTNSERFIIQIDSQDVKLDLDSVDKILFGTGIEIDHSYKPVCINSKINRYVVRGFVDSESQKKIKLMKGIRLFPDSKVESLKQKKVK